MKNQEMKRHRLISLALALTMSAGVLLLAAGAESTIQLYLFGPADWVRVDGQDHDLDEMLSLFRPEGAETLAIFAPLQTWKPFYDKIYGRAPIDLGFYAAIYLLSIETSVPPSLDDWPSFYQEDQAGPNHPARELLGPPEAAALTFRTTIVPVGESDRSGKGSKTTYNVIASLILNRKQILFLNLFQTGLDNQAEMESLALAWRSDLLETLVQLEESRSEQDWE